MRDNNVSSVVDVRMKNFCGLRAVIKAFLPSVKVYEKKFDKEYPFTMSNLEAQISGFNEKEAKLRDAIAALKCQMGGAEDNIVEETTAGEDNVRWWNPLTWF